MGKRFRSRWALLAVLAGAVVVGLATIPAAGSHFDPATSDILRLHMGSQAFFQFESQVAGVDTLTQNISAGRHCELQLSGDSLVTVTASGQGPGFVGNSIGVKSPGSNSSGVPCSRISSGEHLKIALSGVQPALGVALDLELKGATEVDIELSNGDTYTVRSGSMASGTNNATLVNGVLTLNLNTSQANGNCLGLTDSGPDAGPSDNCRIVIHPDTTFNSLTLRGKAGDISLEGGGDYSATPSDAVDTIFYLQSWDGLLDCGQSVTDPNGDVLGIIIRHDNIDGSSCVEKLYLLRAQDDDAQLGDSVIFEFSDPEDQPGFYEAEVHFVHDLDEDGDGTSSMFVGNLEYDPDGSDGYDDFVVMPACDIYPFEVDGNGDPVIDSETGFKIPITDESGNIIPFDDIVPAGHAGCVFFGTQEMSGETVWHAVFSGDWGFRPG